MQDFDSATAVLLLVTLTASLGFVFVSSSELSLELSESLLLGLEALIAGFGFVVADIVFGFFIDSSSELLSLDSDSELLDESFFLFLVFVALSSHSAVFLLGC